MKLVSLLVLFIGMGLMACSSPNVPLTNVYKAIEATKEARVPQKYNIETTLLPPGDVRRISREGGALLEKGQYREAIQKYDKVIELDPQDIYITRAYHNRGLSYAKLGEHERAVEDYNVAIQLEPDYVDSYIMRGLSLSGLERYEDALKDADTAIRLDPNKAGGYALQDIVLSFLGQPVLAKKAQVKACELDKFFC